MHMYHALSVVKVLSFFLFLRILFYQGPGLFCDGTPRYGVPAPFFPSKEKQLFVMYIINE